MNDTFYEQLVAKKSHISPQIVRILVIVISVLLLFIFPLFLGFLSIIAAVILIVASIFYIIPHSCIEYEYSILNHDMQVDVIYNKAKRSQKLVFNLREVEIAAPKGSGRLAYYQPAKVYDFSSGQADARVYSFIISIDKTLCSILMEPDDTMLAHMKPWMGMKLYED